MVTHQDVFCGWVPVLWLGSCLMVGFLSYGSPHKLLAPGCLLRPDGGSWLSTLTLLDHRSLVLWCFCSSLLHH